MGIGIFCAGLVMLPVIIYANRIKTSLRQRKIQHTIFGEGGDVIKNRNIKEQRRNFKKKEEDELTERYYTFMACGGVVVKALRYKPAGRGFDSRWCHWNFSVT